MSPARPPAPQGISAAAQRFLSVDASPSGDVTADTRFPAIDDIDGWAAHVKWTDQSIAERFAGLEFPVETADTEIAGVHVFVMRPPEVAADDDGPVYLEIHGGGLVFGGGDLCRLMSTPAAMARGMTTWSVDYRMPPLHPYPAAPDDCVAVYRALLEQRDPRDIFVGGASAGGNLAAALMVRIKDEGLPMPAGLLLLTPEVDLTESGDSFRTLLGVDNVLSPLMPVNRLYANGHDLADPHLSPLFADMTGWPPTLLQCGTRDLFLSNTVRMHRRLRDAGVQAELHVWEAMPHGGFGGAPEDIEVMTEIRRFLDAHRRA